MYYVHLIVLLFAMVTTAQAVDLHVSVIHISRALHLNAKKELIADITAQVKAKDDLWASIHDGEYIRVTYEQVLDRHYDNSIYARPLATPGVDKQGAAIEVYPVYTDNKGKQVELPRIATFPSIKREGFYKILLTKLMVPTNTFDFKISGGIEIDYIADPTFLDLHDFGGTSTDGEYPYGSLIYSGNAFYGMAQYGGASNLGLIFSIATSGGTLTDLHDFSGSTTDGAVPQGSLALSGNTLYGMTYGGGAYFKGLIFSMATTGGALTDLHDFSGSPSGDGEEPIGSLTISGSTLYGMTQVGGSLNEGIIFSMATTGGALTDLHDFSRSATDGAYPSDSLALSGTGSTLYGMTQVGGASGGGILFSIATTGGPLTDLHDFSGSSTDGFYPYGSPTLSSPFSYARSITVQSSKISGGADLTQFPILVCGNASSGACTASVPGLNQTGAGAHVANANGDDIIFTTDAGCSNKLTWEMENYNASTGEFEAWVTNTSVPLSHSSNTTFYMCYGNAAISTFQSTASAVWDSNYQGVWHLGNGTTLNTNDSTSNGNNGTATSEMVASTAGEIDGAMAETTTNSAQMTVGPNIVNAMNGNFTLSGWINVGATGQYNIWGTYGATGVKMLYEEAPGFFDTICGNRYYANHDIPMTSGVLHYVVWTFNGITGGTTILYIDGVAADTEVVSACTTDTSPTTGFNPYGQYGVGNNSIFNEWRVSNIIRSAGWVQTEYNDQSAPSSFYTIGSESFPTLYGMTYEGGASNKGIIFSMAATGGTLTDLHDFSGRNSDGANPQGSLNISGSTLYGMTYGGGNSNDGMVFSIATTGGTLTDLHDFSGSSTDGAFPYGDIILSSSFSPSFSYYRAITIQSSEISGGADLAQFPILVCGNASSGACTSSVSGLNQSASGAHVKNVNGYDIIFTTDPGCLNKLTWEMQNYNASTGEFEAWVTNTVTPLSHSSNTTFYMCYGNSAISTFQSNASNVWDSNYEGVWHIPSTFDSTINKNNGSNTNVGTMQGETGPAGTFDGSTSYFTAPSTASLQAAGTQLTLSFWANSNSTAGQDVINKYEGDLTGGYALSYLSSGLRSRFVVVNGSDVEYTDGGIPSENNWHYIVGRFVGSSNLDLYIDGVLSNASSTGIPAALTGNGGRALYIGGGLDMSYFSGTLNEARVSNIARSPGWIATEYNNQSAPTSFYTMGSEGAMPNILYGMTYDGGASGYGTIWSVPSTGGTLTDLHDFTGGASTEGTNPWGTLTLSGSTLYGMTYGGGNSNDGMVFSIAVNGGILEDLHDFSGSSTDGSNPTYGSLTLSGSTLYGMTQFGGSAGDGIIFSIATTGGPLTDLHDFRGRSSDGGNPQGSLTLSGNTLYGMTSEGGANFAGLIFSIATTGGSLTDLHDFSGSSTDGEYPVGSLVLSGNTLYGMALEGGAYGVGIIFSIAATGGSLTDLHDFSGSSTDGEYPYSGSLVLSGSTLYGMALDGGAYGEGIIFSIAATGGPLTDLHDFSGGSTDGNDPRGSLILSGSTLYGMAVGGGAHSKGIIFLIATTGGPLTDLHDFSGGPTDGEYSRGSLILSGSTLYGMTYEGGANNEGIIYSYYSSSLGATSSDTIFYGTEF